MKSISKKLKPGAPFLIYLYYAFDNRPAWFKFIWKITDLIRRIISNLPRNIKHIICEIISLFVYFPIVKIGKILKYLNLLPDNWPLTYYFDLSFYVLRTDALDRFGTKFEKRYTKEQINEMLLKSGFYNIKFSSSQPYWCAVAFKK